MNDDVDDSLCVVCACEMIESEIGNQACSSCGCEDCGNALLTDDEISEGVCKSCDITFTIQMQKEEVEAYQKGVCHQCYPEKEIMATREIMAGLGTIPICQDCYNGHIEMNAIHTEFVIENDREPNMREILESAGVLSDIEDDEY